MPCDQHFLQPPQAIDAALVGSVGHFTIARTRGNVLTWFAATSAVAQGKQAGLVHLRHSGKSYQLEPTYLCINGDYV